MFCGNYHTGPFSHLVVPFSFGCGSDKKTYLTYMATPDTNRRNQKGYMAKKRIPPHCAHWVCLLGVQKRFVFTAETFGRLVLSGVIPEMYLTSYISGTFSGVSRKYSFRISRQIVTNWIVLFLMIYERCCYYVWTV